MATCIQSRPLRNVLTTLILTTGLALCDTACAASKRNSRVAFQSVGGAQSTQRRNPQSVSPSKPKRAAAAEGAAVSNRVETADTEAATTTAPAPVSTAGHAAAAGKTLNQPPLMTVTTTTTQSRSDTEVEQTSSSLLAFLIGVAIAAVAGLIFVFRPSRLRSH